MPLPPVPSSRLSVALVEDDVHFQNALRTAMAASPDMELVHLAPNRAHGLAMLQQPPADVLLVDLGLPDGSGIDVIRAAHALWPHCAIMVSTTFGDEAHVLQSIEAGAAGYLLKDSLPEDLLHEIRVLHQGGSPISPLIARQILTRFRTRQSAQEPAMAAMPAAPAAPPEPPALASPEREAPTLSGRELEVLQMITKGFTTEEIAALLKVSVHTVQTYVRRVYVKLKVKSRTQAIWEAKNQGFLP
jgi:DNA-binding NarL/FixJ family response regulator